jgi:AraC-like ligand binding domain
MPMPAGRLPGIMATLAPYPETDLNPLTFSEFQATALAQGFDEVIERRWDPLTVLDTHVHPFSVRALVVRGEMWLSVGDSTLHLRAGDPFELARDVPHAERYGSTGATYWVARRITSPP